MTIRSHVSIGVVSNNRVRNFSTLMQFHFVDWTFNTSPTRRCRVLIEPPSVSLSSDRDARDGFTGLAIKYLRYLEEELNFTCGRLSEWEPQENEYKGFTGLTKYFDDCAQNGDSSGCDHDMTVAGFAEIAERLPRVDFPSPYAFDWFSVVQRIDRIRNSNSVHGPLLLAPFTAP